MLEAGTWIMTNFLEPVGNACQTFWFQVVVPFLDNLAAWVSGSAPWLAKFADTCTSIFKLKYNVRVAGFTLAVAALIILMPASIFKRRRRRRRRR